MSRPHAFRGSGGNGAPTARYLLPREFKLLKIAKSAGAEPDQLKPRVVLALTPLLPITAFSKTVVVARCLRCGWSLTKTVVGIGVRAQRGILREHVRCSQKNLDNPYHNP